MRNWNLLKKDTLRIRNLVFSLPMRNWNIAVPSIDACAYSRFQPTYEELKRPAAISQTSSGPRFQPTYEELKRSSINMMNSDNFRFQPTYEELKPRWWTSGHQTRLSFQPTYEELKPIVNVAARQGYTFSAYLWGIETRENKKTTPSGAVFSAYLWGIETTYDLPAPLRQWRFQPTYEELKLSIVPILIVSRASFQPTYEELKPILF